MITLVKKIIKNSLFCLFDLFVFPSKNIEPKSLLVVRLDAIGDYVLFRNFIEILKKNTDYKTYKITMLGNVAWKDLAESLDAELIDKFIWIDRKRFIKSFLYRYRKLKEITKQGYEIVVYPTYSRELYFGDNIVKIVTAEEKIGSIGDLSNIKEWHKNISNRYYTKLLPAKDEIVFEFYRNKEFFEKFLGKNLDVGKPTIELKDNDIHFKIPSKYAILFIGASSETRKWPIQYFVETAKYLYNHYSYEIVLCGGPGDTQDAEEFVKLYEGEVCNLVGRTDLKELLAIIEKCDFMVTNETSAAHFAVALDIEGVLVISNGNHFGRFTPYPKEITDKYYVAYHPEIEKNYGDFKKLCSMYGYGSTLNIDEISVEKVKEKIDEMIIKIH